MKITSVSFKRKVSDINYSNKEIGAVAEVGENDSPSAVLSSLKLFVDVQLGVAVAPEGRNAKWVKGICEKLKYIKEHPEQPFDFTLTEEDRQTALAIIHKVNEIKAWLDNCGFSDFDPAFGEEEERLLDEYFPQEQTPNDDHEAKLQRHGIEYE